MKWELNPTNIPIGFYAYRQKRTEDARLVYVSTPLFEQEKTKGQWFGPLTVDSLPDNLQRNEVVEVKRRCKDCLYWTKKVPGGVRGRCLRFPPHEQIWPNPKESEYCFEFKSTIIPD